MALFGLRGSWLYHVQQIITFAFLVYVLFLLGRSAKHNAESNQRMERLRAEITALKEENERLSYMVLYQQTDSFKELEARRKLGIKRPGEIVLVLPPEPTPEEIIEAQKVAEPAPAGVMLKLWWQHFFG